MRKIYTFATLVCTMSMANAQVSDIGSYVQVSDVSNTGVTVGNIFGVAVFMWSEANSGAVLGEGGDFGISGNANISADGSVISMSLPNPANDNKSEALLYNVADQSFNYLGYLLNTEPDTSSAWGMSPNGKYIAGFSWTSGLNGEGVVWKVGNPITGLGNTPTRNSRANDVSNDGTVVVGWQESEMGLWQGVRWRNGVQELLMDGDGNILGEAAAVSGDGKTVCGTTSVSGLGYIWNETDGTIYIDHENEYYITQMTSISEDGKTALGISFDPAEGLLLGEGFIWTKEGGKVTLNEYVDTLGYDDLGITFSVPTGISPDGKYIGGIGANFEIGDARGFLIKLPGALSTKDVNVSDKLTVFPNPVRDITTIKTKDKIESAEVYSTAGQLVFTSKNIVDKKIDLSSLTKGIYILKVKTDKGLQTVKIMKN